MTERSTSATSRPSRTLSSRTVGTDGPNRLTIGYFGGIEGLGGNDTLSGGAGDSWFYGGDGNDRITAHPTAEDFKGEGDTLNGGAGNDTLDGGLGADLLQGGSGTGDVLDYSRRTSKVVVRLGTAADDGASGEGDNAWSDLEQVWGGSGSDFILGTGSNNVLRGNAGSDTLLGGGGGADALFGGSGNDRLDGMTSNDYLEGGTGNDTLIGGSGSDTLKGQDGDDWLYGRDSTRDTLDGGGGYDRAQRDKDLDYVVSISVFLA